MLTSCTVQSVRDTRQTNYMEILFQTQITVTATMGRDVVILKGNYGIPEIRLDAPPIYGKNVSS